MAPQPMHGTAGTVNERTFIAIKPDGVQRNKMGEIIGRFEAKGFKLVAMKLVWPNKEKAAGHYDDLKAKKFFGGLCDFFSSGPVCAMVWEGLDAIKSGRVMLGATNPADSLPGSIRGDLCIDIGRNICHGSDCPEAAEKEIAFWFSKSEICDWDSAQAAWVYEQGQSLDHAEGSGSGVDAVDTANPTEFPPHGAYGKNQERTFIAIKPDGVQRNLIGNIIGRFEAKGFKLAAMRLIWPSPEKAAGHYDDLKAKKFFPGLVSYFSSGPVCAMAWEGKGAVATGRVMLGATNPADSLPGSIRGDLCIDIGRNICHGSDCEEAAAKEIAFWFPAAAICDWQPSAGSWVYEQ